MARPERLRSTYRDVMRGPTTRWAGASSADAVRALGVAGAAQGPDRRGAQPRDRLHDALLRRLVRARLRLRARAGGTRARRRRGRHPVDRDRVCRHAGARARRSSASGSRRRCARCCWRRCRGRRFTSASCSASWRCSSRTEVVLRAARRVAVQARAVRPSVLAGRHRARGTIGFAAVGTLFAAMLVRARSRDVLLPVLLYPVVVPVIIAGVQGTAALLQPDVRPRARAVLAAAARDLRRRLRRPRAVDVRAGDERLEA